MWNKYKYDLGVLLCMFLMLCGESLVEIILS